MLVLAAMNLRISPSHRRPLPRRKGDDAGAVARAGVGHHDRVGQRERTGHLKIINNFFLFYGSDIWDIFFSLK